MTRAAWMARALFGLLALMVTACVNVRDRAQVIVELDAAPEVVVELDRLEVTVRGGPLGGELATVLDEARATPTWPLRLTLLPNGEDASRVFEVTVVGRRRGEVIGRARARGRFVAAQTIYTRITLEACCLTIASTCAETETCSDCACSAPTMVEPVDAGTIDAGTPGDVDAGLTLADGAPLDGGEEPGADSAPPGDAGCVTVEDCPSTPCAQGACVGGVCVLNGGCAEGTMCCPDGQCSPNCDCHRARRGTVCREANGDCDVAETCNGITSVCPPDAFAPLGQTCSAGVCSGRDGRCRGCVDGAPCDPGRACARGELSCANDPPTCVAIPLAAGTTCRPTAGDCDVAEVCNGSSSDCPVDLYALGTTCRAANGDCDVAETCSGTSPTCPANGFAGASTVCRAAMFDMPCDAPEFCTGTSSTCPSEDNAATNGLRCGIRCGECMSGECVDRCNIDEQCCPTMRECVPRTTVCGT